VLLGGPVGARPGLDARARGLAMAGCS